MKIHPLFFATGLLTATTAQAQFDFITNDGGSIITGYTGSGGAVTIPATLGGLPVTEIQGSGFENKGITTVSIPDSVTNIQAQEFAPNTALTSFTVDGNNPAYSSLGGVLFDKSGTTLAEYPPGLSGPYAIPGTVSNVGTSAFSACYYLSSVTIPDSVTNIGSQAFGYCFDLTNVTISSNVTGIGPDAFINCHTLTAFAVAAGNPAFSSVAGVLFDKGETTLLAFPAGLDGVYVIPNGVTTLGTDAFLLCDGLTGVTMPVSVTSIEDGAFGDCDGLTNLTLGAGVSYISTSAFGGAVNLMAINVATNNPNFSSVNGVVFDKNQTMLIVFPKGFAGGYTIPASVTSVAAYAFEDCELTDLIIPGNVAGIGLDSFQGCGSLTNVTMSNGVGSLGIFAFADCPKLATVTIPATVTYLPYGVFAYDGLSGVYFEGNEPGSDSSAFLGDSAPAYILPGTSGWGATFDGLSTVIESEPNPNGALEVTIQPAGAAAAGAQWQVDGGVLQPGGAMVAGLSVGSHTVSFTTVNGWITPGDQSVAVSANTTNSATGTYTVEAAPPSDFTYATNAGAITVTGYVGPGGAVLVPSTINGYPVTAIGQSAFANITTVTGVTMPDSVTNLGEYAFSVCQGMTAVTIPAGVNTIEFGTFEDCFSLSSVTFRGAITSIGDYGFASCPELTSLPIPDTATNVGTYAFFGDGLTNATIPAGVISIGPAAFMYCNQLPAIQVDPANPAYTSAEGVLYDKNLTELIEYPDGNLQPSYIISNGAISIGDSAFQYCHLVDVTIPPSVTSIGNYSFESCGLLANVTIPDGVVSLGAEAFAFCNALTGVVLPASVTTLGQIPFAQCINMTSISVAANNPDFSSTNGALYNKSGTQLIEYPGGLPGGFTIPNGVEDIGNQAFAQTLITSVVMPPSVTNIEVLAFFDCLSLTKVTLNTGLAAIGVAAFEDCSALTDIALPATLTSIGYSAFEECGLLATVIIPSGIGNMADYAFSYCANLASAYFEGNALPDDSTVFANNNNRTTVYYLFGATGWGSTFGTAPAKQLPGIAVTASPTSGEVPLPVRFTAAGEDSATNPVANWTWDFGDGSTSPTRNPSHTYAVRGDFSAAVVETNSLGVPVAGEVVSIQVTPAPVYSGLVTDGGFQSGDFTFWNLFGGDTKDNFVTNTVNGVSAYSGEYFAVLGSSGFLSYLSQPLGTTPGQSYVLSFWLNSPDGLTPNEFLVSWNGTTLFEATNLPALGWTNLQFVVAAAGTNTVLEFGFRDDPSILGLDGISVTPLQPGITGVSVAGANLVLDGTGGVSGQSYLVLTSTNLSLPLNEWTPAVTNLVSANGNFSITVTNTVSAKVPGQFYALQPQ